ncbi:MAG: methyltransferase domain-containing protein [Clostridia bacterium]|nr:methyltransferase domain-containing protein [Clostridia bacterium]
MAHSITELPNWERLFRRILFEQMGDIKGRTILDFGSGEGVTANHFARFNEVTAVEPDENMLRNAWRDFPYTQLVGDVNSIKSLKSESFDYIIIHNVLEYIDNRAEVLKELTRLLKIGGKPSVVKHNRNGRIMQMAILLDDFDRANRLLDGENSHAEKFGPIRYYETEDILKACPTLEIEDFYGIRTFFDLQQNQEKHSDENWQNKMAELEMRVSKTDAFRNIAFFHHIILTKKEETT